MNKLPLLIPAALAAIALAACEPKPENVSAGTPDPQAEAVAKKGPVELPPMMTATKTFRCKDQSLATVDFYNNEKQVTVKLGSAQTATLLKAEKAGDPYKADGYELTGSPSGITLASPGKPSQACKA